MENEIIKYCIIDAKLTKELADYFWNLMDSTLNFLPKSPFSKGSYSQEYFLHFCYMPTINKFNREVLKYAYNSYSGGRFELLKRGYFDSVYTYDIKSAYPYEMANLIDYNLGKWNYTTKFIPDAYSGFYLCEINFFNNYLSPFMQKIQGLNTYPNGKFKQYLTQKEIFFILTHFNNVEIEVIDGWYFYETSILHPLQEKIQELYNWKETEKDEDVRYAVKIVMNSLYGKFIQAIGGKTGTLFNPLWASEITANTRLKIIEAALKNPSALIGFSTDSIHMEKPINIEGTGKLGDWELDFKGKGVFIMSDVYGLWNNNKIKSKFRGFSLIEKDTGDKYDEKVISNVLDILLKIPDETIYKYAKLRPIQLGEIIYHTKKRTKQDLNVWNITKKSVNINGDYKRIWAKNFKNGHEALTENISSVPLMLE